MQTKACEYFINPIDRQTDRQTYRQSENVWLSSEESKLLPRLQSQETNKRGIKIMCHLCKFQCIKI